MTKRSLLISATIAAIAIASGNALAQSEGASPGSGGGMPPAELSPPAAGGGGAAPSADPGAANPGAGNAGLERGDRGSDAAMPGENRAGGRDWAGSKGDPDKGKGDAAASKRDAETMKKRDAATGDAARGDKAAGTEKSARGEKSKSAERPEKGWKKDAADTSSGRDAASGASEGTEGRDHAPSGSVTQLSGEKRTKAQSAFRSHRGGAVAKDIDIDLNVGVAVPRTVVLTAVPEDVVVIVPEYRRYKYFVFDDKVIIVDPDTFAIVDILVLA